MKDNGTLIGVFNWSNDIKNREAKQRMSPFTGTKGQEVFRDEMAVIWSLPELFRDQEGNIIRWLIHHVVQVSGL